MEKENNVNELFGIFNNDEKFNSLSNIETGQVVSPLPELEIQVRNLTYKKENIKLNEYWLPSHRRDITIPSSALTGSDSKGDSHISGGFPEANIIYNDTLKAGDDVAVIQSQNKQTLYVLFRIARW